MSTLILPDWPMPARVRACSTTRHGGVSVSPYDSLNLGTHVGDVATHVDANRQLLRNKPAYHKCPFGWIRYTVPES